MVPPKVLEFRALETLRWVCAGSRLTRDSFERNVLAKSLKGDQGIFESPLRNETATSHPFKAVQDDALKGSGRT
jgi:hypothetical protein